MENGLKYSPEPEDKHGFTAYYDKFYSTFAKAYDGFVKVVPLWKIWLNHAVPHIQGPRVLEVSFGTGYLLTQYAGKFDVYGIDYNVDLIAVARKNLERDGLSVKIGRGDVQALPFPDNTFDTLVNTMAFSAYPDAHKAMSELRRVLKPGGRLVLMDPTYPKDHNWPGMVMVKGWFMLGDLVRDVDSLLEEFDFDYTDTEVGGFGTVHLYVAQKRESRKIA
jgi:ubiquinone/menaquinone biosynthesis C-methylase UbiE